MEIIKTSKKEKILYAVGDFGSNIIWPFVGSFLMQYLTDNIYISSAFLGTMMLICRMFDGVSDILMGLLIERTHSSKGKARFWFGVSIVPICAAFALLFIAPKGNLALAKVYVVFMYFLFTVVLYTANNLSYHAMLSRMTNDPLDQSKVSAIRTIAAGVGLGISTVIVPVLLNHIGGINSQKAVLIIVIPCAVIAMVAMLICYFCVKEKPEITAKADESRQKGDIGRGLKLLFKTKYFYIAIGIFILNYMIINLQQSMGPYYTRDVLGNGDYYSMFNMFPMATQFLGVILSPIFLKKFGKRTDMMISGASIALGAIVSVLAPRNMIVCLIGLVIKGLGVGILSVEMFTLAPDIIRYIEQEQGMRIEGLATAANSFGCKIGTGFGLALAGWGLSWGHYNGKLAVQSALTLRWEVIIEWGFPIVASVLILVLAAFWNIESKFQSAPSGKGDSPSAEEAAE